MVVSDVCSVVTFVNGASGRHGSQEFPENKGTSDIFTQTEYTDPLSKLSRNDLRKICQEVRKSSTYIMVKGDKYVDDLPEAVILGENDYELSDADAKKEWREGVEYVKTNLLLLRRKDDISADHRVDLFSCATKGGVRYFHLTNAYFLNGYFFVFNPVYTTVNGETEMEVKLTGLIEPMTLELMTLKLKKFRNRRHMEKVFLNSMNYPRSKTSKDQLCTLNATQQFRLCIAIYDALNWSEGKVSKNRTKETGHLCMENQRITVHAGIENGDGNVRKYLIEEPHVDVVPCYFNSGKKPEFYLTSDPVRENSVFVLNQKQIANMTEGFLEKAAMIVEGAARDVSVLKYAKTFY